MAITDITDPAWDDVVAIPAELLARGDTIQHAKLPFRVVTKAYYPNADLVQRDANAPSGPTATSFGQLSAEPSAESVM